MGTKKRSESLRLKVSAIVNYELFWPSLSGYQRHQKIDDSVIARLTNKSDFWPLRIVVYQHDTLSLAHGSWHMSSKINSYLSPLRDITYFSFDVTWFVTWSCSPVKTTSLGTDGRHQERCPAAVRPLRRAVGLVEDNEVFIPAPPVARTLSRPGEELR